MSDHREQLDNVGGKALKIGLVAAALSAVIGFFSRDQFFESYLMSYIFWLGLAGGSLGLLMIGHLALGRWSMVIQRPLEAATRTFPLLWLLFVPLILGMHHLYEWTHTETVATDPFLSQKTLYLNVPFFLGRAAFYFVVWILLSQLLTARSRKQDASGDPALTVSMRKLSGGGLVLFALVTSFAAMDWMMSLEPHWFSSIYGFHFMIGQGLSTMAMAAVVVHWLSNRTPYQNMAGPQEFHDIGNMLFAFVILWCYLSFSQFIIIWSGNLYEETFWYLDRAAGGWKAVSIVLFLCNFLLPFLLLLMKSNKRRGHVLAMVAIWVLVTRFVDLHWHVAPTFHAEGFHLHALDFLLPVALGGIWIWAFLKQLAGAPLAATRDPRYEELFGQRTEDSQHG
jgi:hypothetical protein